MSFYRRKSLIFVAIVVVIVIIILKLDQHDDVTQDSSDLEDGEVVDSTQNKLFDLDKFRLILDPDVCAGPNTPLLGIIIVTSYVGHDDVRAAHRSGISQQELRRIGLARVFLIAQIPVAERYEAVM